jgi:hypothetical protein
MLQTEARARGIGRRQASVKVSVQSQDGRVIGMPGRANEARCDGFIVHGVRPCMQVKIERKSEGDLVGFGEHDSLHDIENAFLSLSPRSECAMDILIRTAQ